MSSNANNAVRPRNENECNELFPTWISMPDILPTLLTLFFVYWFSVVLQSEVKLNLVKEVYMQLAELTEDAGKKLNKIEISLIKMRTACGLDTLVSNDNNGMNSFKKEDCSKDGPVNWASSSMGGMVIKYESDRTLQDTKSPLNSPCSESTSDPSVLLRSNDQNGCWIFEGEGNVLIQLAAPIYVTNVTIGHFPKEISDNKKSVSIPRFVIVKGYRHLNDASPHTFGAFEYKDNDEISQNFEVQTPSYCQFDIVEFHFKTNCGDTDYTYVCRVEVHGRLT